MKTMMAVIVLGVFGITGMISMSYAGSSFDLLLKGIGEELLKEMAREQFENLLQNDPGMAALYEAYKQGSANACQEADKRYGKGACEQMKRKLGF